MTFSKIELLPKRKLTPKALGLCSFHTLALIEYDGSLGWTNQTFAMLRERGPVIQQAVKKYWVDDTNQHIHRFGVDTVANMVHRSQVADAEVLVPIATDGKAVIFSDGSAIDLLYFSYALHAYPLASFWGRKGSSIQIKDGDGTLVGVVGPMRLMPGALEGAREWFAAQAHDAAPGAPAGRSPGAR